MEEIYIPYRYHQRWTLKSLSTKVKDEEAAFADNLLVKTISDSSCIGFIDDSENVQHHHFCDLPLRVVGVGGDDNNIVSDGDLR